MFRPIQYDSGKAILVPVASTQTIYKGYALEWSSGYVQIATTTSNDVRFVALQDSVLATTGTLILVIPVEGVRFEADCDGVVSIVDRGTYAIMATAYTINPDDSTTYDQFYIDEIVGTAEVSTVVRGHFVHALE